MHDDWRKSLGLVALQYKDPIQDLLDQHHRMNKMFEPPHMEIFGQAEKDAIQGILDQQRRMLNPSYAEVFRQVQRNFESPASRSIRELNTSFARHERGLEQAIRELNAHLTSQERDLASSVRQMAEQLSLVGLGREDYLRRFTDISLAAELRLSKLQWESIGDLLGASVESRRRLQARFTRFMASYGRVYKFDLRNEPNEDADRLVPEEVATLPAAEVYQTVELLDVVSSEPDQKEGELSAADQGNAQIQTVGQVLRVEVELALEQLLAEIDPELINLLNGARAAANSTNPDRVRHVGSSLRELFTHVLHAVAPTEEVLKWSSHPSHYHNGRPTRKARILYVCRSISFGRFSTFILKDIDVSLDFIGLFQEATHEVSTSISTEQLVVMIVRMEGLLRFLLQTARLAR